MAAIAGIVSVEGSKLPKNPTQVEEMIESMRHRGPDFVIVRSLPEEKAILGAAAVNLSPHRTQCASLASSPYIVFDGELFNERPGGQTDLQLFEEYYLKHGKNCFKYLDGSYCCAVFDNDEAFIARDPVGAKPLFYGTENGKFFFSSEMKGLIGHIRFDIQELEPGHLYSTKEGLKAFDPFIPEIPEPENLEHAIGVLRELLIEAVKKRMVGVEAVALSGGLDSSIIAAIAAPDNPKLRLFTSTVDGAEGPDLENAKLMADFLGLEHHIVRITDKDIAEFLPAAVWYLESFDEDCINGIAANYYVSRMVGEYGNTVLVGEGADELFGGYREVLKNPSVTSDAQTEELAIKLMDIAYNTALRRLDRAWMANGIVYYAPFLDSKVVNFSKKIPMKWKIYGDKETEKYVLREAFKDMLPQQIYERQKLRFSMGTGIDDVMDDIVSRIVDPKLISDLPKSYYGMPFASFKEIYYYDEFLRRFPSAYEKQTVRWDPFK